MTENEQKAYDWLINSAGCAPHKYGFLTHLYRQMKQVGGIDVPYADFRAAVARAIINDPESTEWQATEEAEVLRRYGAQN